MGVPHGSFDWTDARVERLRKLWEDGLTTAKIAADFGNGLTRNAVIGKVHRLGLSGRVRWSREEAKLAVSEKAAPAPTAPPRAASPPPIVTPALPLASILPLAPILVDAAEHFAAPLGTVLVDIMDLRDADCRWPFSCDDGATRYCGQRATDGAWCQAHATLAYASDARPTMKAYAPTKSGRGLAMQREARR